MGAALGCALAVGTPACSESNEAVRSVGADGRARGVSGYFVEEIDGGTEVVILGEHDAEIARVVNLRDGDTEVFRVEVDDYSVELLTASDGSFRLIETGGASADDGEPQLSEYGLTLLRMMTAAQQDLGFGEATVREVDDEPTAYSEKICLRRKIPIACAFGFCFEVEIEVCHSVGS